jgi:hypothetical protein
LVDCAASAHCSRDKSDDLKLTIRVAELEAKVNGHPERKGFSWT